MEEILLQRNCPAGHEARVALEVTRNSLEGTYSHGINRFPRLARSIDEGIVRYESIDETLPRVKLSRGQRPGSS
jgi:3-dehydro-L-gulonate 2-dehydrogenase